MPFSLDLDAEAILPPEIKPLPAPVDLTAEPGAVFLTGVTGFVGVYLLRELLRDTHARIYCLVRAEDDVRGLSRIYDNLEQYGLEKYVRPHRIVPVVGDLKLPLFGLTQEKFDALANTVDVIYHCGSKLSYVAPYEFLKAANVGGTVEVLRLATRGKAKPVHYVSSLGILLAYSELVGGQEEDELDAGKCPEIGYFQTKYVAEKVVRNARDRGIPVTIHRIGLIVGDSQTGVCNSDDFVARILLGSIQAGFAPDVTNAMDMTPVDFVAAAMVYLSRQNEALGRVFHLLNPRPIHWSDVFDRVTDAGFPVQKLPFHDWVDAVEEHGDPQTNPLYPLLPFFHLNFARRMLGVSDSHFAALGTASTQKALRGSGFACPPVDQHLVEIFPGQFVESGRLQPAATPLAV
ncbi:MAG: thioester reductase domain-containing protein [Anaerolineae bacterium]|nr:thioester reductase domain-containing protein [Anaerolineae bacterium]